MALIGESFIDYSKAIVTKYGLHYFHVKDVLSIACA